MARVEELYLQGKATNADVAALDGKYYKGYSNTDTSSFLEDIPTVEHVAATVTFLSDKGIPALICTLAWDFVAEVFARRYGFVDWSGPVLVTDSKGVFIDGVLSDFHGTDKPVFVNAIVKEMGSACLGSFTLEIRVQTYRCLDLSDSPWHLMAIVWRRRLRGYR